MAPRLGSDKGQWATARAVEVWDAALTAVWDGPARWFHGDVASGNLLVKDGRLAGVLDFGCCGVGDPACDLVIAWTLFSGDSRERFRRTLDQDPAMWARARGWALWKALINLTYADDVDAAARTECTVIDEVLADHDRAG